MNRFNDMAFDLQSEILKYNPSYLSVRKNLDTNLFYDRYCNQPITVKEFISYINDEHPSQFMIFTETDIPTFTLYKYNNDHNTIRTLFIEEMDINEYVVDMEYTHSNHTPEELLNSIDYDQIYFDLKTTFNILSRRNCEQISSGYNTRMTLSIFNQHATDYHGLNLYSYFDLCKKLIYYSNNYDLLSNQLPRIALHKSGIEEIVFDITGDVIEGDEEIIADIIREYDFKDDIINMILDL